MIKTCGLSVLLMPVLIALVFAQPLQDETTRLSKKIRHFNAKAQSDPIGRDQPPLTEEEVIASIRGWKREENPDMPDEVHESLQRIASTGDLPFGADFRCITRWYSNGYAIDVWWVDLLIWLSPHDEAVYSFRIRERKVRSRPVTEEEQRRFDAQRRWEESGEHPALPVPSTTHRRQGSTAP
jgi:hypothetical protein